MSFRRLAISGLLLHLSAPLPAETVKDREGAVRSDRAKMENSDRWIYNDLAAGFAEAERTGKPLLVALRCVPCLSCMGLDTEVLVENPELTPLMDRFVRVRLINANAIDLSLFQFDYDLSFSILFFNADRTIYGRFGSWEHQHDSQNRATATLRQALERVVALHSRYPGNRAALAGKKGDPIAYRTPVDLPELKEFGSELDWQGKVVASCVHCHQVGDAIRQEIRGRGGPMPMSLLYPYPKPEALGLTLGENPVTGVVAVAEGSVAAKAGFRAGDEILALEGQPLVSAADFSWVLHRFPESGALHATIRRGGTTSEVSVPLSEGWRAAHENTRRVGYWPMRAMAFGGMRLEPLDDGAREARGIGEGKLALLVLHVGQYGKHAAAKNAGFRKDDILVEVAGSDAALTEIELLARNLLKQKPGDKVPVVVLRGGQRVALEMPVQ